MANRINASVEAVKKPPPQPVLDRAFCEPQPDQLPVSHHAMLPTGQYRQLGITLFGFPLHNKGKSKRAVFRPLGR